MRLLGFILFLFGSVGVAVFVKRMLSVARPVDLGYALLSLLAVAMALLGLGLSFAPAFFG